MQAVRQDCIQVLFPNPESDTDSNANFNSFRCDAVRLCQPASCAFDSLSDFVAMLYPACRRLMDGVFDSFPFSFRLLSRRLLCIDHRMKLTDFSVRLLLRKEVIQPHLPIRLPCYDFTPVIGLALDG